MTWMRTGKHIVRMKETRMRRLELFIACRGSWTILVRDVSVDMAADCLRRRTIRVRVLFSAESSARTGRDCGRKPFIMRGCSARSPRLLRGRRILVETRGSACPVLNMTGNTLPPLLRQFVTPLFQLRGDGLDARGLFDGPHFGSGGGFLTQPHVWQLGDRTGGGFIDSFTEQFQNFNGRV
jgi:hypothetical protein